MELLVHPITKLPKHCFPSADGSHTLCNFTVRDGMIWRYAQKTRYLQLPRLKKRVLIDDNVNLIQKEKASPLIGKDAISK